MANTGRFAGQRNRPRAVPRPLPFRFKRHGLVRFVTMRLLVHRISPKHVRPARSRQTTASAGNRAAIPQRFDMLTVTVGPHTSAETIKPATPAHRRVRSTFRTLAAAYDRWMLGSPPSILHRKTKNFMDWTLIATVAVALCTGIIGCAYKAPDLYGHIQKLIWLTWFASLCSNIGFLIGIAVERDAAESTFRFLTRSGNPVYVLITDFDPTSFPEVTYGWLGFNVALLVVLAFAHQIQKFVYRTNEPDSIPSKISSNPPE